MSTDVNLSNIDVDLTLGGTVDFGLDAIASVLSTGVNVDAGLGAIGVTVGGTLDAGLGGISADLGLDDIRLKELPVVRVQAAVTELPLIRTDSKLDLGLDNIRIQELPTIRFELSLRPIRVHLPLSYQFCIEIFGKRLFKFSVCGEGMAITEDYKPHATERCG